MTLKQGEAIKKILENPGLPVSRAMEEVGYSPNTARNPSDLTESKAWKDLMEEKFPDKDLADVHKEGLAATRATNAAILVTQDGKIEKAEEQGLIEVPDFAVRHKYLETAYKLKGKLRDHGEINIQNQKILVMPSDLIDKYAIPSDAEPSSQR